jgi:hypothetical protein
MFDSNGVMYMMRNKYYEQLAEWMVSLCEKVIDKSMLSTGMLSLILPIFSYVTTLLSYGFVSSLKLWILINRHCSGCFGSVPTPQRSTKCVIKTKRSYGNLALGSPSRSVHILVLLDGAGVRGDVPDGK